MGLEEEIGDIVSGIVAIGEVGMKAVVVVTVVSDASIVGSEVVGTLVTCGSGMGPVVMFSGGLGMSAKIVGALVDGGVGMDSIVVGTMVLGGSGRDDGAGGSVVVIGATNMDGL